MGVSILDELFSDLLLDLFNVLFILYSICLLYLFLLKLFKLFISFLKLFKLEVVYILVLEVSNFLLIFGDSNLFINLIFFSLKIFFFIFFSLIGLVIIERSSEFFANNFFIFGCVKNKEMFIFLGIEYNCSKNNLKFFIVDKYFII